MLHTSPLIAFVATAHPAEALRFYRDTLGLALVEDSPFALVFSAGGTTLRVQKVQQVTAASYTALGWVVEDIDATIDWLTARGVAFERFPVLVQGENGVWRSPSGAAVAWFKDPDGNILSLTQYAIASGMPGLSP
jgi:catechol 2,3-dioxygenase-like lactoylglutathione lyase family enzyme